VSAAPGPPRSGAGERWTAPRVRALKGKERIAVLTAYDFPTAKLADGAGVEIVLVGDSLGMVVLGYETTLPVTVDEMVHHTKAVVRARPAALVIADMPFMSYQTGPTEALAGAGRLVKEGGADGVKLEGGARVAEAVRAIVEAGIPVMGHLGLTPQSVLQFGGYRVQGRGADEARRLLADAGGLEAAGAFALVLEGMPAGLAGEITRAVGVPTIGIGAGAACDGQVLVWHDVLGLYHGKQPRFVRRYAELWQAADDGLRRFVADVKAGRFPDRGESYE
jgi:3-methyl-2-oxobutanoate hydroxymethyltransferase